MAPRSLGALASSPGTWWGTPQPFQPLLRQPIHPAQRPPGLGSSRSSLESCIRPLRCPTVALKPKCPTPAPLSIMPNPAPLTATGRPGATASGQRLPLPALHPLLRPQLKPRSFPFTVSASRFPCCPGNQKLTSGRNPEPFSPQVEAASRSLWPLDSCLSPSAWHPRPLTWPLELAPAALGPLREAPTSPLHRSSCLPSGPLQEAPTSPPHQPQPADPGARTLLAGLGSSSGSPPGALTPPQAAWPRVQARALLQAGAPGVKCRACPRSQQRACTGRGLSDVSGRNG